MTIAIQIREKRPDLAYDQDLLRSREPAFVHDRATGRRICICHFLELEKALKTGKVRRDDLFVTCLPLQARQRYHIETIGDWDEPTRVRVRWEPGGYVLYIWRDSEPAPR